MKNFMQNICNRCSFFTSQWGVVLEGSFFYKLLLLNHTEFLPLQMQFYWQQGRLCSVNTFDSLHVPVHSSRSCFTTFRIPLK